MKFLYVKTQSVPAILSEITPKRNLDPWLAWLLEDEEVDRLAIELKSLGYEVDSGVLISLDLNGQNPSEY